MLRASAMTRENIIRYLSAVVVAVVFALIFVIKGFQARSVTLLPVPGHAFAYHSPAAGHENVWPL